MTIKSCTYAEAILLAQSRILKENPNSFLLGINVTSPSAIFGTTIGLLQEFGAHRVIESPASENAITGIALGLATSGSTSILVHQRLDFAILSLDMIINQLAKWNYMYGDLLTSSVIIRLIIGRGWGQGPQHSQALPSLFMHVPGLEVYAPSTPQEVFSTLINASRKNSPTIILEHRWLFDIQGNVAVDEDLPLPKSSIVVSSDPAASVTLVTISFSTLEVTRARDLLSDQNIKIDIIEVSRLDKLDLESIIKSTLKTKKLILVDIGHSFAGASSAILSELYCAGMTLDSPPIILGLPRYPTPTAPSLARDYYPRCIDILNSITSLIGSSVKFIDPDYGKQLDVPGDRFIGYY